MTSESKERWTRIRIVAGPHRGRLSLIALTSFIGGFIEAAFLVIVTQAGIAIAQADETISALGGRTVTITGALLIAVALVAIRLLLALAGVRLSSTLALIVSSDLRRRLADAFLNASWATQQSEPVGRLQQLVSSFAMNAVGVLKAFSSALSSALSLAALLVVALLVDPLATGLVIAALLVLGSVLAPMRRLIRRSSAEAADVSMRFATGVSEYGALGLEMQTYGVRAPFSARIGELIDHDARATRRLAVLRQSIAPVYTTLGYLALLAGIGAAAAVGVGDLASVGAVMLLMLRSLAYGQTLQTTTANLISAIPFLEVVDETLDRFENDVAPGGERELSKLGRIEVRDVSFSYPGAAEALTDISFDLEFGEHLGIVGPSGSGKSTLVQLLLGLREPTHGSIEVGGVDLRDVDRSSWNPLVAFVSQEAQLFSGTVAENIVFFRESISTDDIVRAVCEARLFDDIVAMPDGFDTQIGERGSRLSGGQRQRLSIARALAGRPQMLILDEPTSALDVMSEIAIRQTLAELRGKVSVVVIAHRLSTLELCDRVMVIQDGELRAIDAPDRLAASSDFYRDALELSKIV